jgi:hypothetical protein
MATKIIQDTNIPRVTPSPGVASTSVPIALKSGYLRITIGSTTSASPDGYIAIGTNPVANINNFHISSFGVEIIKETLRRQVITGITTGTSTTLIFGQNTGNPFLNTDYITIEGASTVGLNTTHKAILSSTDSSVTIDFDSSSITSPNVLGATASRSVKVSCFTPDSDVFFNISEVVTLVSE